MKNTEARFDRKVLRVVECISTLLFQHKRLNQITYQVMRTTKGSNLGNASEVVMSSVSKTYDEATLQKFEQRLKAMLERCEEDLATESSLSRDTLEEGGRAVAFADPPSGQGAVLASDTVTRLEAHKRAILQALERVRNKTYGRCVRTGRLIEEKVLMASPFAVISLAAREQR